MEVADEREFERCDEEVACELGDIAEGHGRDEQGGALELGSRSSGRERVEELFLDCHGVGRGDGDFGMCGEARRA